MARRFAYFSSNIEQGLAQLSSPEGIAKRERVLATPSANMEFKGNTIRLNGVPFTREELGLVETTPESKSASTSTSASASASGGRGSVVKPKVDEKAKTSAKSEMSKALSKPENPEKSEKSEKSVKPESGVLGFISGLFAKGNDFASLLTKLEKAKSDAAQGEAIAAFEAKLSPDQLRQILCKFRNPTEACSSLRVLLRRNQIGASVEFLSVSLSWLSSGASGESQVREKQQEGLIDFFISRGLSFPDLGTVDVATLCLLPSLRDKYMIRFLECSQEAKVRHEDLMGLCKSFPSQRSAILEALPRVITEQKGPQIKEMANLFEGGEARFEAMKSLFKRETATLNEEQKSALKEIIKEEVARMHQIRESNRSRICLITDRGTRVPIDLGKFGPKQKKVVHLGSKRVLVEGGFASVKLSGDKVKFETLPGSDFYKIETRFKGDGFRTISGACSLSSSGDLTIEKGQSVSVSATAFEWDPIKKKLVGPGEELKENDWSSFDLKTDADALAAEKVKHDQDQVEGAEMASCVICTENAPTGIMLPCRHSCLCMSCGTSWKGTCPICRAEVEAFLDVSVVSGVVYT